MNESNVTLYFIAEQNDIAKIIPANINLLPENKIYEISVAASGAGYTEVHANSSHPNITYETI